MTTRRRLTLAASILLLAAAGAAFALIRHAERPRLAACYTGFGALPSGEHLVATLRLDEAHGMVTGTYTAGATAGQGIVRGRLTGSRFDGTFTVLGQALAVTGTMRSDQVMLDNPGGQFMVTRFLAGCG